MKDHEKRRFPRFDTDDLPGQLQQSLAARVVNLSLSGMAVETHQPLPVDKAFAIRIGTAEDALILEGRVKWCDLQATRDSQGEVEPIYRSGFEFDDVLSPAAQRLRSFMENSITVDINDRLFGRLEVESHHAALQSQYPFVVKRLSRGGMLIRTEAAPAPESLVLFRLDLRGDEFEARGRIVDKVHTSVGEDRHLHHDYGVEFLDPDESSLTVLERFIKEHLKS